MCPHCVQRRRWNHQPPASSHSTHPGPLGGTEGSTALAVGSLADTAHHPLEGSSGMEPGLYGTDGTDPEEASGLLEAEDTLDDPGGGRDVLDTGWSPPERAGAGGDWGTPRAAGAAGGGPD